MVDDSELDYIVTFLGKVHTVATVGQIETYGNIMLVADTQKMFVLPGELIGSSFYSHTKRYKVQVSETSEANLTTALNNIIIGIWKLNTRQAITSYTRPTTLMNIELASGSTKAFYNAKTKRWDMDIFLDIEWSTS